MDSTLYVCILWIHYCCHRLIWTLWHIAIVLRLNSELAVPKLICVFPVHHHKVASILRNIANIFYVLFFCWCQISECPLLHTPLITKTLKTNIVYLFAYSCQKKADMFIIQWVSSWCVPQMDTRGSTYRWNGIILHRIHRVGRLYFKSGRRNDMFKQRNYVTLRTVLV